MTTNNEPNNASTIVGSTMEGKPRRSRDLKRAVELIASRGRFYIVNQSREGQPGQARKQQHLQVYRKELVFLDLLQRVFGGGIHKHLHTYVYTASKKEDLVDIAIQVFPVWKEKYEEENPKLRALFDWVDDNYTP